MGVLAPFTLFGHVSIPFSTFIAPVRVVYLGDIRLGMRFCIGSLLDVPIRMSAFSSWVKCPTVTFSTEVPNLLILNYWSVLQWLGPFPVEKLFFS